MHQKFNYRNIHLVDQIHLLCRGEGIKAPFIFSSKMYVSSECVHAQSSLTLRDPHGL